MNDDKFFCALDESDRAGHVRCKSQCPSCITWVAQNVVDETPKMVVDEESSREINGI
jgi:hypothetical protein